MTAPPVGRAVGALWHDRVPCGGARFHTDDPAISPRVKAALLFGFYEGAERRFVRDHLPIDRDVVELGGSMGVVTTAIARRLAPGRRIVTVEANPSLVPVLERNVAANAPGVDVTVVGAALDYSGAATVPLALGDLSTNAKVGGGGTGHGVVDVPTVTLSGLLDEHGLDDVTLVSDVEGAEWAMVRDDRAGLDRVRFAMLELHSTTGEDGERRPWQDLARTLTDELGLRMVASHGSVVALTR